MDEAKVGHASEGALFAEVTSNPGSAKQTAVRAAVPDWAAEPHACRELGLFVRALATLERFKFFKFFYRICVNNGY